MASKSEWPVVKPLPMALMKILLWGLFVAGHILLWNDRRGSRPKLSMGKPVELPAFK